ncbi:MAG: lipopolysaccharide assembly protein LapB [Gammaproteobacteria bacterium]|nr:lipopolysaccharide assembly protein LapB [Gammaproteobacteria bacterium]NND39887.1 lipopolysaccharide assembly protein LapB [Pseudomonadales bacterium]MBT8151252.1 lipopolysaccharide assembly protein LapB [Gammaproteobacteria bacterium]NNL10813.1 lipopolysaccharide assembly protein LapB [Pseudomonadales bacterium]NNM12580.1 lipopolysaccharide assembly protein LapB [Pseudomonadales bacterium]
MDDFALLGLLTLAIAIGFFLGRRSQREQKNGFTPDKNYYQGLNYLLNEEPDKAVEEFVASLDVNSHTLETHLALGKLMRRQGQVDRAIRIHQNLLARPVLEDKAQHQVHLELARDFMAAGLLDRAEVLLQEVIGESSELRGIAQRYLLDIFQDEREWQDAIDVANSLVQSRYIKSNPDARREILRMIAHFHCELAEAAMSSGNASAARQYLDGAASVDKGVFRVALLMAANDNAQGRYKQVIKTLSKLELQNPDWFWMCLPALQEAYQKQNGARGFELFSRHLQSHVENRDATPVIMYLVDQLIQRAGEDPARMGQAIDLLADFNRRHNSLAATNKLVELRTHAGGNSGNHDVLRLQAKVSELLELQSVFRCGHCGFTGRQLHWRCPSCKTWESMCSTERGTAA